MRRPDEILRAPLTHAEVKENRERAARAAKALRAGRKAEGGHKDEADLRDMLADCLHLLRITGRDANAELESARIHFEAESEGEMA